jgi:hypothetical protein
MPIGGDNFSQKQTSELGMESKIDELRELGENFETNLLLIVDALATDAPIDPLKLESIRRIRHLFRHREQELRQAQVFVLVRQYRIVRKGSTDTQKVDPMNGKRKI